MNPLKILKRYQAKNLGEADLFVQSEIIEAVRYILGEGAQFNFTDFKGLELDATVYDDGVIVYMVELFANISGTVQKIYARMGIQRRHDDGTWEQSLRWHHQVHIQFPHHPVLRTYCVMIKRPAQNYNFLPSHSGYGPGLDSFQGYKGHDPVLFNNDKLPFIRETLIGKKALVEA